MTYEVTVPLMVKVSDGKVVDYTFETGFPGFFSEAEDACGVWNVDTEEWDGEETDHVVRVAWKFVREWLANSRVKD